MKILIKRGHVVDAKQDLDGVFDILVEDGVICEIGTLESVDGAYVVDAKGKYVLPGFVDAHCHLRDPGQEYKEDIRSGTLAAAKGGFTSIACMPNTHPPIDNKTVVSYVVNKAKEEGVVHVYPIGGVSKGLMGKELSEMGDMKQSGIVAVSDDGNPVLSDALFKKALQYANMFDLRVISHCEVLDLAEDGVMNEGETSTLLGLRGIPTVAEDIMVSRDVLLAEYLKTPVHIAHVSTKGATEIIRQAKKRGVKVTCETCPQYFTLTDAMCMDFNTLAKVYPPLRTQEHVDSILEGLADGTIDIIATDHAPHHEDEKNVEFAKSAKGMLGFETAFGLCVTYLVKTHVLTLKELVHKMSYLPAQILGIDKGYLQKGNWADLVIVDLEEKYTVDRHAMVSKSKNSPFHGFSLYGKVLYTMVDGKFVVEPD
jgi:dihydroorotase